MTEHNSESGLSFHFTLGDTLVALGSEGYGRIQLGRIALLTGKHRVGLHLT